MNNMMNVVTLERRWHYPHDIAELRNSGLCGASSGGDINTMNVLAGKDADKEGPVMSADWHPTQARLVTGGFDGAVKIWAFDSAESLVDSITHISTMVLSSSNDQPCNVTRWSPDGLYIAAAYNTGEVVLWKKFQGPGATPSGAVYEYNLEHWVPGKVLRMHADKEVYTLSFSSNMQFLLSGAFDGHVVIYDLTRGFAKAFNMTEDMHMAQVQGCAWDPLGAYVVTIGADRRVTVLSNPHADTCGAGLFSIHDVIEKSEKGGQLFRGDGASAYYRHGSWSPDGSFLALPCGWLTTGDSHNCAFIFVRHIFQRPYQALVVDGDTAVMGAKFSPVMYASCHPLLDGAHSWGPTTEYTMALAVFTSEVVVVFTTASLSPIVRFTDLHYAPVTDVSWSCDGTHLVFSSEDGSCSLARVSLGSKWVDSEASSPSLLRIVSNNLCGIKAQLRDCSGSVEKTFAAEGKMLGNITTHHTGRKKNAPAKRDREDAAILSPQQEGGGLQGVPKPSAGPAGSGDSMALAASTALTD